MSSSASTIRYSCTSPVPGTSQRRMPPKPTSPTRSRRRDVRIGERRGRADRQVERALVAAPRLGERVDEQDHVGVPLGVALVHPQVAAPRARPPVDALQRVARRPRPDVGELDPLALRPRDLVARDDLRLGAAPGPGAAPPRAGRRAAPVACRPSTSQVSRPSGSRARRYVGPSTWPPQRAARSVSSSSRSSPRARLQRDRVRALDQLDAVGGSRT